ncbi:MAG: hypothetical protein IJ777_04450 [Clostridia bacterium]|nr:hypothetical protein [Clostridia bacterium]
MNILNFKRKKRELMNRGWKEKNEEYLEQLQRFLDIADNIEEQNLRKTVIAQMLKCDLILTQLAEKEFSKYEEKSKNS